MTRVLIVDDEPAVRAALDRALRLDGYEIELAADGREALDRLAEAHQTRSCSTCRCRASTGCEVCRRLRDAGDRTPVLMLTARDAIDDRVAGLDAGADDYLVKPFALKELKARLRALLRRAEPVASDDGHDVLRFADLTLDRGAWEAYRGERKIELSRTEFQLLAMFLEHPRQVLTRSQIFERVWGYDFGSSSNSLGVYMGYLRRKTEEGGEPRLLHTVRGVGYVLAGLMPAPAAHDRRRGRRGRRGGHRGLGGRLPRGPQRAAARTSTTRSRSSRSTCAAAARGASARSRRGSGGPTPYIQVIDAGDGVEVFGSEQVVLPIEERAREVAAGVAPRYFTDAEVAGTHVRVLTLPLGRGLAAQLGRSLEPADAVLARLRLVLALVCVGGVGAGGRAWARLASRNVVAPIVHVTEAARHIAATEDLGRRIEVETHDEVGELAAHFNAMLDTLERSVAAQRQLVADASHELRTPITSLRTNIEVLAESEALAPDERARLLADVEEQTRELGMLVADLIELARGDEPRREREDVRLDELVRRRSRAPAAMRRASGSSPCSSPPWSTARASGSRARSTTCSTTRPATRRPAASWRCTRAPDGVRVRDHGGGIAPEDLPHLFDRFYRGASARGRPGSGLGPGDRAPGGRAARRRRCERRTPPAAAPSSSSSSPLSLMPEPAPDI